ncbi:MAG: hypothetical protein Q4P17_03900 [Methanobacterium sp.]|nr:hypothetical protein [Methanobacterium sp.]
MTKKLNGTTDGICNKIIKALHNNESTDILICGVKGDGKSSVGVGLGRLLSDNFSIDDIVFNVTDYLRRAEELPPYSVIVFDETGTQNSGMSSRNFMSNKNKNVVDVWQMVRTKKICTICITLDIGRIDNRIRETFRYHITPIKKLTDEDTKGHGLAVLCELREIIKAKQSEETDMLFKLKSSRINGLGAITVPLAPTWFIHAYEDKRELTLKNMMEAAQKLEHAESQKKRGRGRPRKIESISQ